MVEQITFQTIFQFLQTLSIMVGISYYILNLRNSQKTRETSLALQFYGNITNKDFWRTWTDVTFTQKFENYREWSDKYGPEVNPDAASNLYTVMQIFVGAGTMLKKKLVDPKELFEYIPHMVLPLTYVKVKPFIEAIRIRYNDPTFGESFEYLYNEAMRLYPGMRLPTEPPAE